MAKEIPEDFTRAPRGFEPHDIRAFEMPQQDAPGALEAQEALRAGNDTTSAPVGFDPLDHDFDGRKGGSLPKAQRTKK